MSQTLHVNCDRSIAEAAPAGPVPVAPGRGQARWILATTILASSLAFIDGSIVNVGLPAIGRSLEGGGGALAWVLNGYLLPLSALLLAGGAAGDLYGRRRLLIAGIVLFAAASLACMLAPDLGWLVAGRLLQGVGAALLMPNSLAILGAAFSGEQRGRAVGIWAAVGAAAGAVAPLLGGWLIDAMGWRAIFAINLPIALAAALMAWRHLPPETDRSRPPLDLAGGAWATLALGALTWALTEWSGKHRLDAPILLACAAGVAAAAAFFFVERRKGERAMLPLALFASRDFVGLTWLTLWLYGALSAVMVLIPYLLIESHGYSGVAAGAALLPLPLMLALTSSTAGRLAGRIGPRWPLTIGPVVAAAGCLLALRVTGSGSYWTTAFPALLVMALGMAGAVAPLTTAVLGSVGPTQNGVASGFNSAVARTGGLLATALLGGVLAAGQGDLGPRADIAFIAAAVAALGAGLCAFVWVGRARPEG